MALRVTWTRLLSDYKSRYKGLPRAATRLPVMVAGYHCATPGGKAKLLLQYVTEPGSHLQPCIQPLAFMRHWCSTSSIPGVVALLVAAPTTLPMRVAEATRHSRSTLLKQSRGESTDSGNMGIHRDHWKAHQNSPVWSEISCRISIRPDLQVYPLKNPRENTPIRWTCADNHPFSRGSHHHLIPGK